MPLLRYVHSSYPFGNAKNIISLHRYAMYSLGVEIYCAPTADGRDLWASTMRHIAAEGRCFVVSVNQFATKKDYPANYPPYLSTLHYYVWPNCYSRCEQMIPRTRLYVGEVGYISGPIINGRLFIVLCRIHDCRPDGRYPCRATV